MNRWVLNAYFYYRETFIDSAYERVLTFISFTIFMLLLSFFLLAAFIFQLDAALIKIGLGGIMIQLLIGRWLLFLIVRKGRLKHLRRHYYLKTKALKTLKVCTYIPAMFGLFVLILAIVFFKVI